MLHRTPTAALIIALAACAPAPEEDETVDTSGQDTTPQDTSDDDGVVGDDTATPVAPVAPVVVEMFPADGAVGVLPNRLISLKFSEPMDHASVEAALSSVALGSAYTVSWTDDTRLSIASNEGLPVVAAEAQDQGVEVDLALSTGARSKAGLELAAPWSGSFRVARSYEASIAYEANLTGRISKIGAASSGLFTVGDTSAGQTFQAVATFDVTDVPRVVEVDEAVVLVKASGTLGDPWGTLGDLLVDVVDYDVLKPSLYNVAGLTTPVVGPGKLNELGSWTADVASLVTYAFEERATLGDRIQLRFAFEQEGSANDQSDSVEFLKQSGSPKLVVSLFVE